MGHYLSGKSLVLQLYCLRGSCRALRRGTCFGLETDLVLSVCCLLRWIVVLGHITRGSSPRTPLTGLPLLCTQTSHQDILGWAGGWLIHMGPVWAHILRLLQSPRKQCQDAIDVALGRWWYRWRWSLLPPGSRVGLWPGRWLWWWGCLAWAIYLLHQGWWNLSFGHQNEQLH